MQEFLLGIKELPGVAGKLATGRLYAVMHDADLGLGVAGSTVAAACATSGVLWVAEEPSSCLALPGEPGRQVVECLSKGVLRIFQANAGGRGDVCRRMLKELDFLGGVKGGLVVVEGADRFLEHATPEAKAANMALWQQWAERVGCVVLWMFPRRAGQAGCEADLLRMPNRISGLARMRKSVDGVRWDIYYWFASEGLMADKSFHLNMDDCGYWRAADHEFAQAENAGPVMDADDVFVMRAALPGGRAAPDGWRIFETSEQMSEALSLAHAPTVVFHYDVGAPIETIAHPVFDLRRLAGPDIKIAVRTAGGRPRLGHEQLLLNVGANLVIADEAGFARMLSMLKSLQGQTYARALPASFEEAMNGVMAIAQSGYLAPADFGGAVSDVMKRSESLGVYNALVHLYLTPGLDVLETLRCCTMTRPGDFFTADDESLYVFLFACEEQNVSATLDRLFRLPVPVLFPAESRFFTAKEIDEALDEFEQRVSAGHCEDFTAALAQGTSAHGVPSEGADMTAHSPVHRAFTSVRHALALRTTQI